MNKKLKITVFTVQNILLKKKKMKLILLFSKDVLSG